MNPYETLSPNARMIYDHIAEHGSITSTEAYEKYGIYRAASRIHEIRKAGIGIHTERKKVKTASALTAVMRNIPWNKRNQGGTHD